MASPSEGAGNEREKTSGGCPERLLPYQWKKGQSGNPKGRPKGSGKLLNILQRLLSENGDEVGEELVKRFLRNALTGDGSTSMKAIKEVLDRIEGPVSSGDAKDEDVLRIKRVELFRDTRRKVADDDAPGDDV